MGRGGHNAKSSKDLKNEGTYRPDRHGNRLEGAAKPMKRVPKAPDYFDERHRKEWDKCCAEVFELGILLNPDLYQIEMFVIYWFMWFDARALVVKQGSVIEGSKGPMKNPAVNVMNEAAKLAIQIGDKFGFNPRARMGIKTDPKPPADPFDQFLNN